MPENTCDHSKVGLGRASDWFKDGEGERRVLWCHGCGDETGTEIR